MSKEKTEYWIRQGQGKAIALLHGIGAKDPQDYWHAFLDVLVNDKQLQHFGLFVWKYPTHVRPGRLEDIASTVMKRTLRGTAPSIKHLGAVWDTTYHTQFRDDQEVVLVCHSMGGLVVKSWIIDTLERGQSTTLATLHHISFYATPHNGAPITTLAKWNKQLKDMQLESPFIEDIGNRWHEHVVAWKEKVPGPEASLYNRYIPHLVISGLVDRVVPSNYATIRGMPLTPVQGDHSEVIQPIHADDTRYKVWRNAIDESLPAKSQRIQTVSGITQRDENEDLLASPSSLPQQITVPSPASLSVLQQQTSASYRSCVLSYATEDQAFAEKLHADLTQQGVSCWFAPHDLKMGDKLRDKIYEAIQRQDKLLIVLSEHAIGSVWVEEEVDAALDREHQHKGTYLLFPIRLDDQVLQTSKAWAVAVRQRYIADFRLWMDDAMYQRALQRLLRDLKASSKPIQYYTCFISYSSRDQAFAERLYADLQSKNVRCWYAPEDLKIGNKFRVRIDESIQLYDKLLLILSEHSVRSPWVETEVETAFEKEHQHNMLVLFPVKLDNTVMETEQAWAADIRRKRHIGDFTRWKEHDEYQKGLNRLLRDLKQDAVTKEDRP